MDEYMWDLPPSPRHLALEGHAGPGVVCGADPQSGINIVGTRNTADCPDCLLGVESDHVVAPRWADVKLVADAVKRHVKNRAYLETGGSNGCALCQDRTLEESLAAGHRDCGVTKIKWETAQSLARSLSDFDMDIAVSRALEDPRLFQWVP